MNKRVEIQLSIINAKSGCCLEVAQVLACDLDGWLDEITATPEDRFVFCFQQDEMKTKIYALVDYLKKLAIFNKATERLLEKLEEEKTEVSA